MYTQKEIEEQRKNDIIDLAKRWDALEAKVAERSNAETAKRVRAAFEDYYKDMYGDVDLIGWIGNLYDPVTGGFYYSNSGRDNEGFLPDMESTCQAISWIRTMGTPEVFGDFKDIYPEWMQRKIVKFVKERQDENGYFYHPQWPRELTDKKTNRRGRDLNWACKLLDWFGDAPTYDTPNGVRGNGLLWDGTPAPNYKPCDIEDAPVAPKEELVDPRFKDKESFEKYLQSIYDDYKDLGFGCWYPIGNRLEAEGSQIVARDKVLRANGADYSLCDIAADWMSKAQNPKNGLWVDDDVDGEQGKWGANALLKISMAYNNIQRPMPRIGLGIKAAIDLTNGDLPVTSVCSVLNTLYAMTSLISNLRNYSTESEDEKKRIEDEHMKYMYEHAPEIIKVTKERIIRFKKPDGGFSYTLDYSSPTSQGHPVAIPNSPEGDVNATSIATAAVVGHIFNQLGLNRIPVFTNADKMRLLNIFEERERIKI